jgi:hypothetical protein
LALLTLLCAACSGEELPTGPGEVVDREPPDAVTGTVIAADSFVVPAIQTDFTVQLYSSSGALVPTIAPSAGRLLVLSLWDQSRPSIVCVGGVFDTNCALLVVFPNLGSLSVQLASGRRLWHLQSNFTLDEEAEPG